MLILGQKLPISLILRTIKFFLKKSYFYPFSKACNQIKFQKNLEKTLKSVDFRPQKLLTYPILSIKFFSQKKKAFVTFLCLLKLHFVKKNQKKVMTYQKKKALQTYGCMVKRTGGRMGLNS